MKHTGLARIVVSFFLLIAIIAQFLVQTGCANIIPPEGGPKDTIPPVLRKANPPDSTRNFDAERIVLQFDEYVNADNYLQEMIVSPVPLNAPVVSRKLNTVTVRLRDTLQPNTTYTINFGKTIKDVNEGNIMEDFSYIFSTGSYLDSLGFSGNVVLAETGEVDTTLTVMLHKNPEDSSVIKEKPSYIAKLDGRGIFRFKNLPPGTFYLYALKDEGGSYRYMNPSQIFGFLDSAVIIGEQNQPVTLYAYSSKEKTTQPKTTTSRDRQTDKRLKFTTNLAGGRQDLLDSLVMTFETPLRIFDSTKVQFATDSSFMPVSGHYWQLDSLMATATLYYPWQENTLYHLILEKDFATDTLGFQLLKADTISFTSKQKNDYGELTLRFRNLDLTLNPVLQFVQSNQVKKSVPLTSAVYTEKLFQPGDYNLRLLLDRNQNGVWDPGVFFGERRQPELVKPIQRTINVKPGWENQFDIDINAAPTETRDQPASNPADRNRPTLPRRNTRFGQ